MLIKLFIYIVFKQTIRTFNLKTTMTEKKINELNEKRSMLENDLKNVEKQIYDLETRYLEDT